MSKSKKVKAVTAFAPYRDPQDFKGVYLSTYAHGCTPYPVFVLPADAESYDRMVEQGVQAICGGTSNTHYIACVKCALRAIGITRPATKASANDGRARG